MCPPVCGAQMQNNFKYVNNIHNFILFIINCVEFYHNFFMMISYIYIHTTHILISFFKDQTHAGKAPTKGPYTSNSREIDGIFA
jgi:hypothetical protein